MVLNKAIIEGSVIKEKMKIFIVK